MTTPAAVTQANQLINDLITGPFMNGVVQYGIARGSLVKTIVLDTKTHVAPGTWDANGTSDRDQLLAWFKDGTVTPTPVDTPNLLYFLLLPTTTTLTAGTNPDGTPNTNVCGWHSNGSYSSHNFFWGLTRTDSATQSSAQAFVNSVAFCVGHELVESFTDTDNNGYIGNGCEIGDICETKTFFAYRGWTVEQYWSNWDSACIQGDKPVSLRKFLTVNGFDATAGLRALGFPRIGVDSIAKFQCLDVS